MSRPDYTFYHQPTTDEMRQRAVQAINDFLSIHWTCHKKIAHNKNGAVSHKRFIYDANTIHAGLPYADAGKGIFQFYEFYDPQTGRLNFFGTPEEFNTNIGGTCGCGVVWSWATVCHSLNCIYANYYTALTGSSRTMAWTGSWRHTPRSSLPTLFAPPQRIIL